jgi:hypothetical protein
MANPMTNELTHSERFAAEKAVCILLVRGESPESTPIFAYVAVRADRLEEFMQAQSSGMFYPEDFGVIVESGEGEPSAEIREKMEREYGFNHSGMIDIPNASAATEITSEFARIVAEEQTEQ